MLNYKDFEKRSCEMADATRRLFVALNTGGIAVTFSVAGGLVDRGVNPSWTVTPVCFFVAGLAISAGSLLLAKHKAIKRRDACGKEEPNFKKWYWRNFTYEIITLIIFVFAVGVGLYQLQQVDLNKLKAGQEQGETKENFHNKPYPVDVKNDVNGD